MRSTYHVAELGLEPHNLIAGLRHSTPRLAYQTWKVGRHERWPSANYRVTWGKPLPRYGLFSQGKLRYWIVWPLGPLSPLLLYPWWTWSFIITLMWKLQNKANLPQTPCKREELQSNQRDLYRRWTCMDPDACYDWGHRTTDTYNYCDHAIHWSQKRNRCAWKGTLLIIM